VGDWIARFSILLVSSPAFVPLVKIANMSIIPVTLFL